MHHPEDITKVLTKFPIEDIWGIGRRFTKMLKANNILTAEQFRQLSPEWVKAKMSVTGLRTWKELHGEPCIPFGYIIPDKQSICISRSFAKEINSIEQLTEILATFVSIAAEKLRKQHSLTRQMQIFILNDHYGKNTVSVGTQGSGKIPAHQENLSPRYTTHWDEIMIVKAE